MPTEALPPRPWRQPSRPERRPRPALTRDAIVDAALSIIGELGADSLTMRRVAERLGVAAASLYGHVSNKEELVQLLMDRVFGELSPPDPAKDWKTAAKDWLRHSREVLRRHPGVAGLTLGRIPVGASSFANMEILLGLALSAGIPPKIVAFSGDLLGLYLGAFVHEEDMYSKAGPEAGDEMVTMFRDWLKSLPADRFPNLVKLADLLTEGDSDERFELGLDVLLRGIESYIPARSAKSRAGKRG